MLHLSTTSLNRENNSRTQLTNKFTAIYTNQKVHYSHMRWYVGIDGSMFSHPEFCSMVRLSTSYDSHNSHYA
jgi:hypothetical protein